jgi:type IV pilus assembly protein PilY1
MKNRQNNWLQILKNLTLAACVSLPILALAADPVDFASSPLADNPLVDIKPNMLYVMDDSGSMGRDYMPDWANDNPAFFTDASYNSIAYNPAIVYSPPVNFTGSGKDTTTYPSQTGASTATGADFSSKPNWKSVKRDPYLSNSTTNLEALNGGTGPEFWTTIATEYCTKADLKVCVAQSAPTPTHSFPAPVRWCNTGANAAAATPPAGSCQAVRIQSGPSRFDNLRSPGVAGGGAAVATITFTSANSTPRVNQITVSGQDILRRRTQQTNSLSGLANDVRNKINDCTNFAWGNCSVSGYSASVSGNTVTIYAPAATTATPTINFSRGSLTSTVTAFNTPPAPPVGGRFQVSITPGTNSYPYPNQTTKAAERTDCVGTTCTYVEEMTNYANWYAYYRTRILMMKTSSSLAFENVGDEFRIGYMTIHPGSNQRIDLDTFSNAHKASWYSRLFDTTTGSSTPLRQALSQAGRIFANKETISGTFSDPIEYECQQNFTLLTTDGFWNNGDGKELNGTTTMGNYDASPSIPPYYEGGTATSNTLADVAKYYRDTDLRTTALGNCTGALGTDVCQSVSASAGPAPNLKQTMATLTLGLGVDGTLAYSTDYKTDTVGDFADIRNGVKNWPVPSANDITTVDDLWHAAVNGDGTYFSAKKPTELVERLKSAIASIQVTLGNGATAAATSLNPIPGSQNFFYITSYNSGDWTGNLEKRSLDLVQKKINPTADACVEDVVAANNCTAPGAIQPDGAGYSCVTPGIIDPADCAGTLVGTECKVPVATSCTGVLKSQVTRNILFNNGGILQPFDYSSLTAAQQATFDPPFLQANLTQGPAYTPAQQANLTGDKLVNYLKGDTTFDEGATLPEDRLFRKRKALLGDLVNSEPLFIGEPSFDYGDSGYLDFRAAQAGRNQVVYVGANDGMLHAFDADTLVELWAYVPSMVIPNMWKLADANYAAKHSFYVNGDFQVADICVAANCNTASASAWKTILVGSLGSGGRGYFALDITDPASPNLLWEFDASAANGDVNLGYSFGRPIITKRPSDNRWVVLLSSGYNNIPDSDPFYSLPSTKFKPNNPVQFTGGDGVGRLFIIDAKNGTKLNEISTAEGSSFAPSGLGQITTLTPNARQNNTSTYVYGGDLNGNVWRFDISTNTAFKFTQLIGPDGPQPITTKMNIGRVGNTGDKRIILIGTGKYLEVSDLSNTDKQTLYGITDTDIPSGTLSNPRSSSSLIEQVLTTDAADPDVRTISTFDVDLSGVTTIRGWYIDLPDSGERQDVNAQLVGTNLLVPTTVTESTACQPDGYSWQYQLNYLTGSYVVPGGTLGTRYDTRTTGNAVLNIGGTPVNFRSSTKGSVGESTGDGSGGGGLDLEKDPQGSGFQIKRSIWREITE